MVLLCSGTTDPITRLTLVMAIGYVGYMHIVIVTITGFNHVLLVLQNSLDFIESTSEIQLVTGVKMVIIVNSAQQRLSLTLRL